MNKLAKLIKSVFCFFLRKG